VYSRLEQSEPGDLRSADGALESHGTIGGVASVWRRSSTSLLACSRPEIGCCRHRDFGGTHRVFTHLLPHFGIKLHTEGSGADAARAMRVAAERIGFDKIRVLFRESPGIR